LPLQLHCNAIAQTCTDMDSGQWWGNAINGIYMPRAPDWWLTSWTWACARVTSSTWSEFNQRGTGTGTGTRYLVPGTRYLYLVPGIPSASLHLDLALLLLRLCVVTDRLQWGNASGPDASAVSAFWWQALKRIEWLHLRQVGVESVDSEVKEGKLGPLHSRGCDSRLGGGAPQVPPLRVPLEEDTRPARRVVASTAAS